MIHQDRCAMKVTTDSCLFGAWAAQGVGRRESLVVSPESLVGRRKAGSRRILDIGTGTGLLTLMLAQKSDALIDTIEIDKDTFEQAKENISASPWKERIKIYHADAREFSFKFQYDIIISNPPFYENELKSPDEKKNLAYHSGLRLIELLEIISHNLHTSGQFYLLLPAKRTMESAMLISKFKLHVSESISIKQSLQHDHFRVFIKGEHQSNDEEYYTQREIAIRDDQQQYTPEFIDLLKDYYLHL